MNISLCLSAIGKMWRWCEATVEGWRSPSEGAALKAEVKMAYFSLDFNEFDDDDDWWDSYYDYQV